MIHGSPHSRYAPSTPVDGRTQFGQPWLPRRYPGFQVEGLMSSSLVLRPERYVEHDEQI